MKKSKSVVIYCLKKGWHPWASTKKNKLKKRQLNLDKDYVFSSMDIEKLRTLNKFLYTKQIEIKKKIDVVLNISNKLKKNNKTEKCNYFVIHELFSKKWYFETYEIHFQDSSFYTNVTLGKQRHSFKNDCTDLDNWNEFSKTKNHPLQNEKYCYLLRHIRCCGYLAWDDILKIDEVYVQTIIESEFLQKVNT